MSVEFGIRLREIRKLSGHTTVSAARELGVSQPTYNTWELGTREPNIDKLAAICRLLDTTPNVLLGFEPPPAAAPSIRTGNNSPIAIGNNITQNINTKKRKVAK